MLKGQGIVWKLKVHFCVLNIDMPTDGAGNILRVFLQILKQMLVALGQCTCIHQHEHTGITSRFLCNTPKHTNRK